MFMIVWIIGINCCFGATFIINVMFFFVNSEHPGQHNKIWMQQPHATSETDASPDASENDYRI